MLAKLMAFLKKLSLNTNLNISKSLFSCVLMTFMPLKIIMGYILVSGKQSNSNFICPIYTQHIVQYFV